MRQLNKIKYAYVYSACIKKDYIYLASRYDKKIFVMNKRTYQIDRIIELEENKYSEIDVSTISEIIIHDEIIYTLPNFDSFINIVENGILLKKIKINENNRRVTYAGCVVMDNIWVLPLNNSDNMYSLDTKTMHLKVFPSIFKSLCLNNNIIQEHKHTIFTSLEKVGDNIWFALRKSGEIYCYNTVYFTWKNYNINIRIIDFSYALDKFWILTLDGTIYNWNINKKIDLICKINRNKMNCLEKDLLFSYVTYKSHMLWCLPDFSNIIYIYDLKTKSEKYLKLYNEYNNERCCQTYSWDKNFLYIFSQEIEKMWIIDSINFQVKEIILNISEKEENMAIKEMRIVNEKTVPLEFWLNSNSTIDNEGKQIICCGAAIYQRIKPN